MSTLVCCSVGCKVYSDVMDRGITTLACCSVGCKVYSDVMDLGITTLVCCSVGCKVYSNVKLWIEASQLLSAVVLGAKCAIPLWRYHTFLVCCSVGCKMYNTVMAVSLLLSVVVLDAVCTVT